jgi:hypothetical protein
MTNIRTCSDWVVNNTATPCLLLLASPKNVYRAEMESYTEIKLKI